MSLKKQELDFEIVPTGNPKTIVFVDSSDYFESPDRPLLQVFPPGHNRYFVVNIMPGKVNTLNSSIIGLAPVLHTSSLVDLADGVWTFTYMICPYDKVFITKYYLRTTTLDQKLNQVFDYADCDCEFERNEKFKNEIVDIILLVEKAKANAAKGEVSKASEAYQKASKRVNKLLDRLQKLC